ncbi:hypothetical protein [Parasphingorhabdus sp.]|uniref:hypothetical protein n=1 Tax=Parasphingorhabdus sp. TaxID=2709688 RepID=UPI002F93F406
MALSEAQGQPFAKNMNVNQSFRKSAPLLLIWLAVCGVLVFVSWDQIASGMGWGPDDQLRQVQLRDWMAGQSWFDTVQYRIAFPDSQPMHWPRLIELPLALLIALLGPVIGAHAAEVAAMVVVPLAGLGLTMWLTAKISGALFPARIALLSAALTATAVPVVAQLRPMRIDHHGWQIVLALVALWTMFWPDKRKAGLVMGSALALWLSISLEGLPLSVAFIALLAWRWVAALDEGVRLFWTLAGFLGSSILLYLINHGQFDTALNHCDAISPAHLLACIGGAVVILPAIRLAPASWPLRLIFLALAGAAALGILYATAPQCIGGAFGELDPLVRDYWLVNVGEGLPVWNQPWDKNITLFGGSIIVGLGALIYIKWKRHGAADLDTLDSDKLFILAYALIWALIMSLLVQRAAAVAAAYAVPLMAWAVDHAFRNARAMERPLQRILASVAVVFLILPGPITLGLVNAIRGDEEDAKPALPDSTLACDSAESLARLNALPQANIIAPFDFGPQILVQTPHAVLATSHHRNDSAMADQIRIFTSAPQQARDILEARNIRYIAACPGEAELEIYARKHPDGLWDRLSRDEGFDWLQPVHLRGSGLLVWRVVPREPRA